MTKLSSVRSLLLNASYEPMRVVNWQKALVLWFQEKVEIIEYHEVYARSAKLSLPLPSVMRLKTYIRPRKYQRIRFCRENIYLRDEYMCQYCADERVPLRDLTLDHVLPLAQNGPTNWVNVVTACRTCNQKKGNRTPDQANMPLLKVPVEPRWLPEREWDITEKVNSRYPLSWHPYLRKFAG